MAHLSTIKLLRAWARWGIANNIDYPSMSPMFGERALKSPLYGIGHAPADVLEVEAIICGLEFPDRDALIQRYQRRKTWEQMAYRIGCEWRTAKKRTQCAEDEVHRRLTEKDCGYAGQMVNRAQALKTVTV